MERNPGIFFFTALVCTIFIRQGLVWATNMSEFLYQMKNGIYDFKIILHALGIIEYMGLKYGANP